MGNSEFEDDIRRDEAKRVKAEETERCALLCEMRGDIARASASKLRTDGTFTSRSIWPPFKLGTFVMPKWERAARDMEQVGEAFDMVAHCIRKGYDPRDLQPHEKSKEHMVVVRPGVDGDPSLHTIKESCDACDFSTGHLCKDHDR
jgi:hypothetical protein